jgi:hypothetical protein
VELRTDLNGSEMRRAPRYAGQAWRSMAQLSNPDRSLSATLRLRRSYSARSPVGGSRTRQAIAADYPGRLPWQSLYQDQRTIAMRGIGRGLAKVEPASPNTRRLFSIAALNCVFTKNA